MKQIFRVSNNTLVFSDALDIKEDELIPEGYAEYLEEEGKYKEDGTLFVKSLDELKAEKIESLNSQCEAEILRGFTSATTGYFYGFNTYDQINFTQQYSLLLGDPSITSVDWKTEDSGVISHTRDQFITVASVEAVSHKRNQIGKYWMLKAQVETAVDQTGIDAVVW